MPDGSRIDVRPYEAADARLLERVAQRLHPGQTVSPREPNAFGQYFADLARGHLLKEPGAAAFVATIDGEPQGVIAVHPDADAFTGHARLYIDILVVAPEAEGQGVGRLLLRRAEDFARQGGFREVVLDVFTGNEAAIAFYERCGYRPDHVRMAKPLV
jgi:ribosomal protein S18 acetylase RimI-like enzyme